MHSILTITGPTSYSLQFSAAISEATCMQAEGAALSLPYYLCKGELPSPRELPQKEWASKGISVNAIAPGYIATEMTRRVQIVFWDRSRLGGGVDLKISWDPSCSWMENEWGGIRSVEAAAEGRGLGGGARLH